MLWVSGVLHAGRPADATPLNAISIIIIMVIAVNPIFFFISSIILILDCLLRILLSQKINAPPPIPPILHLD
jgi:hypothetical protein